MMRFPVLVPRLEDVVREQIIMLEAVCSGAGERAEQVSMHHVLSFETEVQKIL